MPIAVFAASVNWGVSDKKVVEQGLGGASRDSFDTLRVRMVGVCCFERGEDALSSKFVSQEADFFCLEGDIRYWNLYKKMYDLIIGVDYFGVFGIAVLWLPRFFEMTQR